MQEKVKIRKAKEVLLKIAHGANPITGDDIGDDRLLNDPRIIRCFYFTADVLDNLLNGNYSNRKYAAFVITPEQKDRVVLPEQKIGVTVFARCVNEVLDMTSRKLTGVELNKRLKQLNVLGEVVTGEGKTATTVNDNSLSYGFELEHHIYNGREYDKVVINDKGKKYLLENLESIMSQGDGVLQTCARGTGGLT